MLLQQTALRRPLDPRAGHAAAPKEAADFVTLFFHAPSLLSVEILTISKGADFFVLCIDLT